MCNVVTVRPKGGAASLQRENSSLGRYHPAQPVGGRVSVFSRGTPTRSPTCVLGGVVYRACKSRARKRGWGRRSIYAILTYRTLFCFWLSIELFQNSVFQLYCPKDYYKQKQWNILPVTMITEIMNFNRLLRWMPWVRQDIYDLIFLVFISRKLQLSSIVRILFLWPVPN